MTSPIRLQPMPVAGRWCVHAYYTTCPWAGDGSGRLLIAGADRSSGMGEALVLDADGGVQQRLAADTVDGGFWHTGRWQTWSPDCSEVYLQGGTLERPRVIRHRLADGAQATVAGDMEGAPPTGEPILSGLMGMLYAAGYGDGTMHPERSPVPFAERERHGLFRLTCGGGSVLALSTAQAIAAHPDRDRIAAADAEQRARTGDGLTLMCYCVRWNRDGSRLLFHLGNHCVDRRRGEPRLLWLMTARPDLTDVRLALDLSFGRRGVHWSWQPDGRRLVGYGPDPDAPERMCLAEVGFDGGGYRRLSRHASGGHPSVSPADPHLIATDEGGRVLLIDSRDDTVVADCRVPHQYAAPPPPGRNPFRVCHHPVWDRDGSRLLINTLPGPDAVVAVGRW